MRSLCAAASPEGCGGRCLTEWLQKHVAAERHQTVLASADCINDIAVADDEEDIADTLGLDSWPPLARRRFLRAWRQLKEESQGDAAPAAAAPAAAPVAPPAAVAPAVEAPAAPPVAVAPVVAPAAPPAAPPVVAPAAPPAVAPAVAPATPPVAVAPAAPAAALPALSLIHI